MKSIAFAALALAALNAGAQTPPAPRIRDSAGVRIVEHATIKKAPVAFTIDPKPLLDLGGTKDDPREEFDHGSPFLTAKHLSDGRIVTTDNSSLKIFDAKGTIVRIIGRRGQGPGEFNQVEDVCVGPGDTIIAIPYAQHRISVFDSTGRHVRTFATEGSPAPDACFPDGSVLVRPSPVANPASRLPPDKALVLDRVVNVTRIPSTGAPAKAIGQFPAGNSAMAFRAEGNIVVHGDSLYAGDGQLQSVAVYTAEGRLVRSIRWNDTRVAITDEMFASHLDVAPMRGSDPEFIARFNERLRTAPKPAFVPVYRAIKVDAAGGIWLQDYPMDWRTTPAWTVFDASGRLLGRVTLPAITGADKGRPVELMSIERDDVVLHWFDEADGGQHLSFHTLHRAIGSRD